MIRLLNLLSIYLSTAYTRCQTIPTPRFPVSLFLDSFFLCNYARLSLIMRTFAQNFRETMSNMTPTQFLEHIKKNAFKDIDLAPVTTLQGDKLRTFTLEQLERLRGWMPDANAALWLSDQFWTSDRNLTMRTNPHPWLAFEWEMKDREQMPDLSDDEYTIACWIEQLALLSHDLYCHEPFDVEQLSDGLQGRFTQTELYEDSFRYDNKPLVEWIKTTPYRRIAAMVCYTMVDQETDWAVQNNQAVQDYYAMECWRDFGDWGKLEDCEDFINRSLTAMQKIEEHYQKGHAEGLSDEEIRVLDIMFGFAPHNYCPDDYPAVRDICAAAQKHLPQAPYIKSEQGQRVYGNAVFADLEKIFAQYNMTWDPSDPTDLTMGYLDAWVYDKYYKG